MPAPKSSTDDIEDIKRAARAFKSAEAPEQLVLFPLGVRIKMGPGETRAEWPAHLPPPRVAMTVLEQQPDGSLRPIIRAENRWVKMREDITEELGMGIGYNTLRRLMTAGFVRWCQPSPGQYSFDLQSWYEHLSNVRRDPDFWAEKGKNRARYDAAL